MTRSCHQRKAPRQSSAVALKMNAKECLNRLQLLKIDDFLVEDINIYEASLNLQPAGVTHHCIKLIIMEEMNIERIIIVLLLQNFSNASLYIA